MRISVPIVSLIVAVVGIFVLILFWKSSSHTPPQLRIAVSETPLSAPVIIAASNGYFQKHGVNVELIRVRGGVNCMKMLLSDEVDLATTSDSVVMFTRFERDDFGVLASFAESDNDVKIMTLASKGGRLSALESGTAGVVPGSASEFFLDAYMTMEGLSADSVDKKGYQPHKLGEALLKEEVDYISVWEPYSYLLSRDYPQQVFRYETRGINSLHFLLSHKKDSDDNSLLSVEVNDAVIVALQEANRFINAYPGRAKTLVADFLNLPNDQLAYLWPDYTFRLTISDAMLLALTMQANWAIDAGKTASMVPPDFRGLFAHSPLLTAPRLPQAAQ